MMIIIIIITIIIIIIIINKYYFSFPPRNQFPETCMRATSTTRPQLVSVDMHAGNSHSSPPTSF